MQWPRRAAGNAQAWRLLGTAHAENDDDRQAIAAMAKALAADPTNPEVLLALGVSHVNELQQGQAVSYLMRCALLLLAASFCISCQK